MNMIFLEKEEIKRCLETLNKAPCASQSREENIDEQSFPVKFIHHVIFAHFLLKKKVMIKQNYLSTSFIAN